MACDRGERARFWTQDLRSGTPVTSKCIESSSRVPAWRGCAEVACDWCGRGVFHEHIREELRIGARVHPARSPLTSHLACCLLLLLGTMLCLGVQRITAVCAQSDVCCGRPPRPTRPRCSQDKKEERCGQKSKIDNKLISSACRGEGASTPSFGGAFSR